MRWSSIRSLFRSLTQRSRLETEMSDEMTFHVESRASDLVRLTGCSQDEALRQARLEFGSKEKYKEHGREARGLRLFDEVRADLRYAARTLFQNKGWTTVLVLSLALGIGANTVIFGAIDALLLKSVPVSKPEELVRLKWSGSNDMLTSLTDYGAAEEKDASGKPMRTAFSYRIFQEFLANNQTMTGLFAASPFGQVNAVVDGEAELLSSLFASGSYYRTLGVGSAIGRTFTPDDDTPQSTPVATISYGYWERRFGRNPGVVGKVIRVANLEVTIVGVTPKGFTGVQSAADSGPDITIPLTAGQRPDNTDLSLNDPTNWSLEVMGRLNPGVRLQQVQGNLGAVFQETARAGWEGHYAALTDQQRLLPRNQNRNQVPQLVAWSGSHGFYDASPRDIQMAVVLSIVVALVLLIVCANVANLLLSRSTARRREMSVRLSLGATRARVIRQLLTESILLAAIAGALGLVLAFWGRGLIPGVTADNWRVDWHIFGFAAGLSILTGIAFGLMPALRVTRNNLAGGLKESGRSVTRSQTKMSSGLLAAQVAISLILLTGAGLFLRTLSNLRSVDVGFNPQNILVFSVNPEMNQYEPARIRELWDQMLDRLRTIPNVSSVTMSDRALLGGHSYTDNFFVQGRRYDGDGTKHGGGLKDSVKLRIVDPNFFETLNIPVLKGRGMSQLDEQNSPKVALINETAARKYFPDENPIGNHFGSYPDKSGDYEIIGVVRDVKYLNVRDEIPPAAYLSARQEPLGHATFELRTTGSPGLTMPAVRDAVRHVDPTLPIMELSTQSDLIEGRFREERLFASAYTLFGTLALFLASIGLFGLMSYSVARRTNEIGVRMALGAKSADVMRLVMKESLSLVLIGIVIGLAGVFAAGRLVASLLYGLATTDPLTIACAVTLMILVSALASYLPARRASRVDPTTALRCE